MADAPQEEQEEIVGDAGGLELSPDSGESVPYGADGGAAAEGHVSDDGTAEGAIEDTTSDFEGVVDGFSILVSDDLESRISDSDAFRVEEHSSGSEGDSSSLDGSVDSISQVDSVNVSPRAASKGFQVFLNSVISSLGANFGDTVYSDLTGWSGDGLIRVLIITIADIRQHLFKYLPQIDSNMRLTRVDLDSMGTFWQTPVNGYYVTTLIYYIFDRLGVQNTRTSNIYDLMAKQWGAGYGGTKVTYDGSPADNLEKIRTLLLSKVDDGYFTTWIYYIYDNGLKLREQNDRLYSFLSSQYDGRYFTTTVGYIYNALVANGNLVSKGFSDVLGKLGSLSVSVEVDLSGVESRLDSIVRLLTVAGVVENAKDVLDAIFGDMSLDATEAASAAVGSAIQNAFPFCVPAVLKQILGLLQADPAPPEFHFDFWGAPLDFGFSDWQGLADMTSWLSRIGFAVVLFANSRRFVYSGGVAGD